MLKVSSTSKIILRQLEENTWLATTKWFSRHEKFPISSLGMLQWELKLKKCNRRNHGNGYCDSITFSVIYKTWNFDNTLTLLRRNAAPSLDQIGKLQWGMTFTFAVEILHCFLYGGQILPPLTTHSNYPSKFHQTFCSSRPLSPVHLQKLTSIVLNVALILSYLVSTSDVIPEHYSSKLRRMDVIIIGDHAQVVSATYTHAFILLLLQTWNCITSAWSSYIWKGHRSGMTYLPGTELNTKHSRKHVVIEDFCMVTRGKRRPFKRQSRSKTQERFDKNLL